MGARVDSGAKEALIAYPARCGKGEIVREEACSAAP